MELREHLDESGRSRFRVWFKALDATAAARVQRALTRLEVGHESHIKGVGAGVFELKIDFGPGYRVYFGKDGNEIVILLGGGTKKRQHSDIRVAHDHWQNYKRRKKV